MNQGYRRSNRQIPKHRERPAGATLSDLSRI
jgi:hypothetical protein